MTDTDGTSATLRYAVLHHTGHGPPHYDLLFETSTGSPLLTFRSAVWPITRDAQLERLADHRPIYLDYQGPVSGGRGEVRAVARGRCAIAHAERDLRITFEAGPDHPPLRISELPHVGSASADRLFLCRVVQETE